MKCNQVAELVGEKWEKTYEQSRRVYGDGLSPTVHTSQGGGGQELKVQDKKNKIRKLTPLECWRLMGFDDSDFQKASEVCSDTQLYKQAGNSIVVNVLEGILKNLFLPTTPHEQAQEILKWLDEVMEVKD